MIEEEFNLRKDGECYRLACAHMAGTNTETEVVVSFLKGKEEKLRKQAQHCFVGLSIE
jgi:hypothetical protein